MPQSDEESVRARLNEIALRYPQAELARRTRLPNSSVSRYLKGNRIPVSFVAGVGREFGVNPAWLLYGEGAPWIADIRAEEGKLGGKLTELVQTMGRLSKLKLGALAGKQPAQKLRELNDALESFERVRAQLSVQSRATYQQILDDWNRAIGAKNIPTSRRLAKSAEQVARLCQDADLARRHEILLGSHEYYTGSMERALKHRKRAYFSALPEAGEMDNRLFFEAFSVVVTLDALGRYDEARRFAESVLKLAPHAAQFESYHRCLGAYGWVLIQAGFPHKGIGVTMRALEGQLPEHARHNCTFNLAYALHLTGSCDLTRAAALVGPKDLVSILFLCAWGDDAAEVESLLARHYKAVGKTKQPGEWVGRAHLLSLRGRHAQAIKLWREAEEYQPATEGAGPHRSSFTVATMRTQVLRKAGKTRLALAALDEAQQMMDACAKGESQNPAWVRIHWRNVLALHKTGTLHQRALKFARLCRRRGLAFEA